MEKNAFYRASVESLLIPSCFSGFEKGWNHSFSVNQITISPGNLYFKNCEENENMIVGKSNANKDDYDILVFASKNIKEISIPSFITQIGSYSLSMSFIQKILIPSQITHINEHAFDYLARLHHVEFPLNSKLEIIEKYPFYCSNIESILHSISC